MKKTILLLFAVCLSMFATAQHATISGQVRDTLSTRNIPFASVSLLKNDSTLLQYARSDQAGKFIFDKLGIGKYILLVEHPQFVIHSRAISIKDTNEIIDLKQLAIFNKKQLLKTVVIQDKKAIVIKGDTVTFAADSFATKAGDVVEDLLKLLPGMQVDGSGNITNQGKKVETVLVNGEEFFGTDPTIATQNLPSKAVDKVEVYDSKDAQEQFTGFTTDKDTKVINLKLKKEYNRGVLGKIASAGGWEDRWEQKVMLNRFADKEQMSAYYLSSSNGSTGIGWNDRNTYGGETGGTNTGSDNPYRGSPYGLTKTWKAGARYANKFEKNKQELNISYGTQRTKQDRNKKSFTENLLPDATFYKDDTEESVEYGTAHALNLRYETDLDSLLRLEYYAQASLNNSESERKSTSNNRNDNEAPISFNNTDYSSSGISTNLQNRINLNKKFKKEDRTLSFRVNYDMRNSNTTGFLKSENALDLLNGGSAFTLDQQKKIENTNNSLNTNVVYTEPLSKKLKLKLSYHYGNSKNNNSNITSDTVGYGQGNFGNQLDSLSNIFNARQITQQPGIEFRYEVDKWQFNLENEFSINRFIQEDALRNNNFNYNQFNYVPSFRIQYKLSKYRSIRLSYNGRTQAPSANQLQPFQDNTNPLSVIVGNPNLRMGYNQNVSINFNSHAPIEGHYSYIGFNAANGINRIGTTRTFESSGRTITSYINLPNDYRLSAYGNSSHKISHSNFRYEVNFNGAYSYTPNFINGIAGENKSITGSINPGLNYNNKELLSFDLGMEFDYTNNRNSGNTERQVEFWSYKPNVDLDLFFPGFFTVSNYMSYEYTPAVAPYTTPFKRLYWHPSVTKQFLPKRNLILKFEVLDAFNQNQGYNRSNDVNYNTETFYNTLGRYWLIGATWNFFAGPSASRKGRFRKKEENTGQGWLGKKKKKDTESVQPDTGSDDIIIIVN